MQGKTLFYDLFELQFFPFKDGKELFWMDIKMPEISLRFRDQNINF